MHSSRGLANLFDAVIFLTDSNWRTEPRSNRYHYATRFARVLPVFFVQPDHAHPEWTIEDSGHPNLFIVHCSSDFEFDETRPAPRFRQTGAPTGLRAFLTDRGIRNPLFWQYNYRFQPLLHALPEPFRVFHATEDFTLGSSTVRYHDESGRTLALDAVRGSDLLVAVSDAVRENYLRASGYRGKAITLANGCDYKFWEVHNGGVFTPQPTQRQSLWDRLKSKPAPVGRQVCLYQGGINSRLDFELIRALIRNMSDWDFWFCGPVVLRGAEASEAVAWNEILAAANVRYFGMVSPERIAELSRTATVGLAPFKDTEVIYISLPLKAYEYVACGLPVVTPPIRALENRPDLFEIARGAEAFEQAIRRVAPSRHEPQLVTERLRAAQGMDYDTRFKELELTIVDIVEKRRTARKKLNILILYDDAFSHIKTIQEHLQAFSNHSRHRVFFMAASDTAGWNMFEGRDSDWPQAWDFDMFDAVVWHYGMPASLPDYLSPVVGRRLAQYDGLKVLFIQDEYENTSTITKWIAETGIQLVMTCVPPEGLDYVYPPQQRSGVEFIQTLTGFVPEDENLERFVTPMADRTARIGYRGRVLPYHYGQLGYEKFRIGEEMRQLAQTRGVHVDIEVDDSKRIYGDDWYRFLGSVRATLGTESGSNVFDFDGRLKALATEAREAGIPFQRFYAEHLEDLEGHVRMNQVSPKFFEAIRLRTALVCFDGEYSGVIEADKHYIPLKKDFSNADEVFAKLEDLEFLETLTARAYADVIESGRYSYGQFFESFDEIVSSRVLRPARAEIISAPIVLRRRGEDSFEAIPHRGGFDYILNDGVLRQPFKRRDLEATMENANGIARPLAPTPGQDARTTRRWGPEDVVCYDFWRNAGANVQVTDGGARITTPAQAWHYAAGVELALAQADFDANSYWLKVVIAQARGGIRMGLFNAAMDELCFERELPQDETPVDLVIALEDPGASLLLFRTGEIEAPAEVLFCSAELLVRPK